MANEKSAKSDVKESKAKEAIARRVLLGLRDKHREEYDGMMREAFSEAGYEWTPRLRGDEAKRARLMKEAEKLGLVLVPQESDGTEVPEQG